MLMDTALQRSGGSSSALPRARGDGKVHPAQPSKATIAPGSDGGHPKV